MTDNLFPLTRRAALVTGAAAAASLAIPTTFSVAANAASTKHSTKEAKA